MSRKGAKLGKKPPKKRVESKIYRQRTFLTAYAENAFNASAACRQIGLSRKTYTNWISTDAAFAEALKEATESRLDELEGALMAQVRGGNVTAIIFALKTIGKGRGYVEASPVRIPEAVSGQAIGILDRLLSEEIDPATAGLEFARLGLPIPEGLRLLIQRQDIVTEVQYDFQNAADLDAELERKYRAQMERLHAQETKWLPTRQTEVKAIKDELKDADSFGPEAKA